MTARLSPAEQETNRSPPATAKCDGPSTPVLTRSTVPPGVTAVTPRSPIVATKVVPAAVVA
ncbi:MAG: hypothetical protein J07HX64_02288 [halophilic archaeon J07HX64]|nr:MAG: hypothetical protein J07HX64_02288 [halophilic archaeon J07HX64]